MFHGSANISCSLWRTHAETEGKCEKEGAAEKNCCVLTIASHSLSPVGEAGRKVCSEGVKLNMVEGRVQVFQCLSFSFQQSVCILIGNKLISLTSLSFPISTLILLHLLLLHMSSGMLSAHCPWRCKSISSRPLAILFFNKCNLTAMESTYKAKAVKG